jgi:adenine phosphoribosyltransferase
VKLVKKLGGDIVECAFLIELPDLKGRAQIADCPIFALMEFEGE